MAGPCEYAGGWVDGVIASQFSIHFVHGNDGNFVFQLWECWTCLDCSLSGCRMVLTPVYLDVRDITIKSLGKKLGFSKLYVQNVWQVVRR